MNAVIDKLRSTVTNVKEFLPGNPIGREFDVGVQTGSAGPGLLWRVYEATKRTGKSAASVFVLDKKTLDRLYARKSDRDAVFETLKKGVQTLTKLRHPRILSVYHPFEESRDSVVLILPETFTRESLEFLHGDAKMLHSNICPESVLVTKGGAWKLAGFEFSQLASSSVGSGMMVFSFQGYQTDLPPTCQPHVAFMSPEHLNSDELTTASDVYSLGALICCIFSGGKTLFPVGTGREAAGFEAFRQFCRSKLRHLSPSDFADLPKENGLAETVVLMMNVNVELRPSLDQLVKIGYFEHSAVATLKVLDSLMQRDNLERSHFFKGLPALLRNFPLRVLLYRVLPPLFAEFNNHSMVPFVLPAVLTVASECSDDEFKQHILGHLRQACQIDEPVQVKLILLQNLSLLLKKTPSEDVQNFILPMVFKALEPEATPQILELCMKLLPTFAGQVEFSSLKNAVLPRLKKLCLKTTLLSTRVQTLVCIGQLLEFMDKWTVQDDVLPFLEQIPSREPAVLMAILGIYQVSVKHPRLGLTKETAATKALPFLIPLCIDNGLNLKQFDCFLRLIRDVLANVESQHRTKLESVYSVQLEQKKLEQSIAPVEQKDVLVPELAGADGKTASNSLMDDFWTSFGFSSNQNGANPTNPPKASVSSSSSTASSNGPTVSGGTKTSLSLAEKQRLAALKQDEHSRSLSASRTSSPAVTSSNFARTSISPSTNTSTSTLNREIDRQLGGIQLAGTSGSQTRPTMGASSASTLAADFNSYFGGTTAASRPIRAPIGPMSLSSRPINVGVGQFAPPTRPISTNQMSTSWNWPSQPDSTKSNLNSDDLSFFES